MWAKPVILVFLRPVVGSQMVISRKLPLTRYLPSGDQAIDSTSETWAALTSLPSLVLRPGESRVRRKAPVPPS